MLRRDRRPERTGTPADVLVVGLGNPGEEFKRTRHNVGADVVEMLATRHGARLRKSKERALTDEVRVGDKRIALYPSDHFKVTYSISFDHPMLRHQARTIRLTEDAFIEQIAPARTFCFLKEVEMLRQRARPYLFSNSLAPAVVGASLKALDLIGRSDDLRERLAANTAEFRRRMTELGFDVLPGEHPIVPVMVGDAQRAARLSEALVGHGVFAVAFSYPVVPMGSARIRTQMSAAHSVEDLDQAVEAFVAARAELAA